MHAHDLICDVITFWIYSAEVCYCEKPDKLLNLCRGRHSVLLITLIIAAFHLGEHPDVAHADLRLTGTPEQTTVTCHTCACLDVSSQSVHVEKGLLSLCPNSRRIFHQAMWDASEPR